MNKTLTILWVCTLLLNIGIGVNLFSMKNSQAKTTPNSSDPMSKESQVKWDALMKSMEGIKFDYQPDGSALVTFPTNTVGMAGNGDNNSPDGVYQPGGGDEQRGGGGKEESEKLLASSKANNQDILEQIADYVTAGGGQGNSGYYWQINPEKLAEYLSKLK